MRLLLRLASSHSIIVLFCFVPLAAQERQAPREDRIDNLLAEARQRIGAPAMSVAIAQGGTIIYLRSFGMADLENAVLARPSTVFRTASLAKPITAAAVLQLVEEGKLSLAASIRTFVSELPPTYDDVTVRDLLRHTSGVRHYRDGEFITTLHCRRLRDALEIFASDPLDHRTGEKITYSSYGYTLLGLAIESASGMPYLEYVRKYIFAPAAMRKTWVDDLAIVPDRAAGYTDGEDGLRNAELLDSSCRIPAGGFVSTAEDMVRFAVALDQTVILKPVSVRDMMTSHLTAQMIENTLDGMALPPDFEPPGMGYGWAVLPREGVVYHGGNQPGATAMLYHDPGRHLSVAIMTNIDGRGDALTELAKTIAAAALNQDR